MPMYVHVFFGLVATRLSQSLFTCLGLMGLCVGMMASPTLGQSMAASAVPLTDLSGFQPTAGNWQLAGGVRARPAERHHLDVQPGAGILVNLPTEGARDNLFTTWTHGDIELDLEFMMPSGSNAGIYLQGRYEIQMLDSWGVRNPTFADCGGIYERWDDARPAGDRGYEGHPPRLNVSKAPGLWQRFKIIFQAPRFDASGRKTAPARFVRVEQNGVVIHENVAVTGPTRAAAFADEQPMGPLMIQGDHGPVALRNIRYKVYGTERVMLSDLAYTYVEGPFEQMDEVGRATVVRSGAVDGFRHVPGAASDRFGITYTGQMRVPQAGTYHLEMVLDWVNDDPHFRDINVGEGMWTVGGEAVVVHDGKKRQVAGAIALEAGLHDVEIRYYKNRGWVDPNVFLSIEGPGVKRHLLNAPGTVEVRPPPAAIPVEPGGEPVLLRSFVVHRGQTKTHVLSVGTPEGLHYSVDLSQGSLLMVWRGGFMDAAPMWSGRGNQQTAIPQGSVIPLPGSPLVVSSSPEALRYQYLGYQVGSSGYPTLTYQWGAHTVRDLLVPLAHAQGLQRTVRIEGDAPLPTLALAHGAEIIDLGDGWYAIDGFSHYLRLDASGELRPTIAAGPEGQVLRLSWVRQNDVEVSYALIW